MYFLYLCIFRYKQIFHRCLPKYNNKSAILLLLVYCDVLLLVCRVIQGRVLSSLIEFGQVVPEDNTF